MGLALMDWHSEVRIIRISMLLPSMRRRFYFFLILISVFLEMTLFNYMHYATLFTSEHFGIAYYNKISSYKQEKHFEGNVIGTVPIGITDVKIYHYLARTFGVISNVP